MKNLTINQQYKLLTKEEKKANRKRFQSYILRYKRYLILIILATILMIGQASLVPKITQLLIDKWLPKSSAEMASNEAIRVIISLLIGMGALIIIKAGATFVSAYIIRKFQQNIEMDLKLALYQKILKLKVNYFDKVNEGYFLSRMMRDTSMAAEYARYIPENILNIIISFTLNFTFIFIFSWIIGLTISFLLLILFVVTLLLKPNFLNSWNRVRSHGDEFNQFLVNSFAGIRETKAYTWEESEVKTYQKVADNYQKAWRGNFLLYGKWMTFNASLLGLLTVSIWSIGSWAVVNHYLTIGQLTALSMYGVLVIEPINKLLAIFDLFMRGSVALNRIFQILDEPEEKQVGPLLKNVAGKIEFKDVILSYNKDIHALKGISFTIKPGEKVAFVGTTGSGKSTILKALVRFYDPQKGKILIDDQDITKVNLKSLRESVTLMAQEPYIFFDSLRKNIIFGNELVDEAKYESVKADARVNDFLDILPEQDQTNIGPRGISLSGGQKQRVALARAFLKPANIILFDEATSALDNKTEKLIKDQIKILAKDKTAIFIAHRLTTIQDVDRIFVLENGKIVEEGNHLQLLKQKGKYFELVKSSSHI